MHLYMYKCKESGGRGHQQPGRDITTMRFDITYIEYKFDITYIHIYKCICPRRPTQQNCKQKMTTRQHYGFYTKIRIIYFAWILAN